MGKRSKISKIAYHLKHDGYDKEKAKYEIEALIGKYNDQLLGMTDKICDDLSEEEFDLEYDIITSSDEARKLNRLIETAEEVLQTV